MTDFGHHTFKSLEMPFRRCEDSNFLRGYYRGYESERLVGFERFRKDPVVGGDTHKLVEYRPCGAPHSSLAEVFVQESAGGLVRRAPRVNCVQQDVSIDQKPQSRSIVCHN